MKPLIDPINTSDGKFHGKDKQTGDLATIVTPEYMNNDQDATRSMQREIISILTAAGINPEEATDTQLLTALKKVLITADDERVKNALQKGNNLSDVSDKAKSLANLGGYPSTGGVLVNDNAVITLKAKTANNGVWLLMQESDGSNLCYLGKGSNGNNDTVFNNYKGGNNSIILRANGSVDLTAQQSQPINLNSEPRTTSPNAWRIAYGDYGAFWRQDGANLYLMMTNKGDPRGNYNALRPLTVNVATGAVSIGTPLTVNNEITSSYNETFAWADQYKTKAPFYNAYSTTGASEYHPLIKQNATITGKNSYAFSMGTLVNGAALTWHLHMKGSAGANVDFYWDTNGNFTAPGELIPGSFANFDARYYTQTAANGKFQPKGNYTPAGQAFTKSESDARYQKGNTASKAASGWYKDTNTGIIFQWGTVNRSNFSTPVRFPMAFPNICVGVSATLRNYVDNISSSGQNIRAVSVSRTGFQYGSGGASENQAFWFAIGY